MFSDSLLREDFDEVSYLRHILHLPDTDREQLHLNQSIELTQQQLRAEVAANCDALLEQVDAAVVEEQEVAKIRHSVTSLSASVKRLKHTVEEPFEQVSSKVRTVQHAVEALEILRTLQKFCQLVQKTPEFVATDLCRAARSLRDMEDILNSNVLKGIAAADQQLEAVTKLSAAIRSKAHDLFKTSTAHHGHLQQHTTAGGSSGAALHHHQQTDLSTAVQCFYSLGTLGKVVANMVAENKRDFLKLLVRELDTQQLQLLTESGAGSSGGAEGVKTREVILAKLDAIAQDVIHRATSLMVLWKLLQKKKDPATHEAFITAVDDPSGLLREFWNTVSTHFLEKAQKMLKRPNILLMLVAEYPRYYGMLQRVALGAKDLFVASGDPTCGDRWVKAMIQEVESKFLSSSAERHREKLTQLTARLSSLIPVGGAATAIVDVSVDPARPVLPAAVTALDPKGMMRLISQELTQYRQDPYIVQLLGKGIHGTLTSLHQRLVDALQRIPAQPHPSFGPCTASYVLHLCIANACTTIVSDLSNTLHLLPSESAEGMTNELLTVVRQLRDVATAFRSLVADRVVAPMFHAAASVFLPLVDAVVLEVHNDDRMREATSRCGFFVSRYALLLERSTPGLEEAQRQLLGALLRRVVLRSVTVRPLPTEEHWNTCLTQLPLVLSTMPHLPYKEISYWKGNLKAVKNLFGTQDLTTVRGVDKRLVFLHAVQRATLEEIPALSNSPTALVEQLEEDFGRGGAQPTPTHPTGRVAATTTAATSSDQTSEFFRSLITVAIGDVLPPPASSGEEGAHLDEANQSARSRIAALLAAK